MSDPTELLDGVLYGDIVVTDEEAMLLISPGQLADHIVRRSLRNMVDALDSHKLHLVTGWPVMAEEVDHLGALTHYRWKMELKVP